MYPSRQRYSLAELGLLPLDVEEKLLRLMDYFSLNYGAVDIILTPDEKHVFLELNPCGEFLWLERNPGLPISDAIADVLLGHLPHRGGVTQQT